MGAMQKKESIEATSSHPFTAMKRLRCFGTLHFEVTKCAADFSLLNLPKGKSLGRSKPATNS
jgi:hypothetical protein